MLASDDRRTLVQTLSYTLNDNRNNYARLNLAGTAGAWSARTNNDQQWIRAASGVRKWLTGVLLQGNADCCGQWVNNRLLNEHFQNANKHSSRIF